MRCPRRCCLQGAILQFPEMLSSQYSTILERDLAGASGACAVTVLCGQSRMPAPRLRRRTQSRRRWRRQIALMTRHKPTSRHQTRQAFATGRNRNALLSVAALPTLLSRVPKTAEFSERQPAPAEVREEHQETMRRGSVQDERLLQRMTIAVRGSSLWHFDRARRMETDQEVPGCAHRHGGPVNWQSCASSQWAIDMLAR